MKLDGMIQKFLVVNQNDLKYLSSEQINQFGEILGTIDAGRVNDNKSLNNYVVINTDEPYINDVVDLMKRNGHWG